MSRVFDKTRCLIDHYLFLYLVKGGWKPVNLTKNSIWVVKSSSNYDVGYYDCVHTKKINPCRALARTSISTSHLWSPRPCTKSPAQWACRWSSALKCRLSHNWRDHSATSKIPSILSRTSTFCQREFSQYLACFVYAYYLCNCNAGKNGTIIYKRFDSAAQDSVFPTFTDRIRKTCFLSILIVP